MIVNPKYHLLWNQVWNIIRNAEGSVQGRVNIPSGMTMQLIQKVIHLLLLPLHHYTVVNAKREEKRSVEKTI